MGAGQGVLQLHTEGDGVPEVQQGQLANRRLLALQTQNAVPHLLVSLTDSPFLGPDTEGWTH